jgi:hypothetical protein
MSKSFGVSNGVNVIQKSNKNKDVQRMNFGPNDCPEEQQNTRYDKINSTIQKRRVFTKKELQQKLNEKNINAKGTLAALQATCQNHGIPIEEVNCKVVDGWEGKPKGMLQVLWEHGFINTAQGEKKAYNTYS